MITYTKTFNDIKLGLVTKKTYIDLINSNKVKKTIKILIKYNVILGYMKINESGVNIIRVYLNTVINSKKLHNFYRTSNPYYVKYKLLQKLNNKYTKSIYIIMSSHGFIDLSSALKLGVGGILLWKIL